MKRVLLFWAASGLLHFLFWLWLAALPLPPPFVASRVVELRDPPPAMADQPVERRSPVGGRGRGRAAKGGAAKRSHGTAAKALLPSLRASLLEKAGAMADGAVAAEPAFDDPRGYRLSAENYDLGNARRGFLEALYERINGYLIFNSLLAQYNHFGTVYLEFDVEPNGLIDESSIHASARDGILKVHAIRSALLPALSRPLNENLWLTGGERLRLRTRFEFLRSKSESTLFDENSERITGLALSFRRFTAEGPVAKTLGRHLLNGGISYDIFAMYEAWEKYEKAGERRRLDVDPFALYRGDKFYN